MSTALLASTDVRIANLNAVEAEQTGKALLTQAIGVWSQNVRGLIDLCIAEGRHSEAAFWSSACTTILSRRAEIEEGGRWGSWTLEALEDTINQKKSKLLVAVADDDARLAAADAAHLAQFPDAAPPARMRRSDTTMGRERRTCLKAFR